MAFFLSQNKFNAIEFQLQILYKYSLLIMSKFVHSEESFLTATKIPRVIGSISKTASTSGREQNVNYNMEKMKKYYEEEICSLENRITLLEEDIQYENGEHQRELENLKVLLEYEFEQKILSIRKQLREEFGGMEIDSRRIRKENQSLLKQNEILKNKNNRIQNYCKELETDIKQVRNQLTSKYEQTISKTINNHMKEIQKINASHQFEIAKLTETKNLQLEQVKGENQKTKNKLSQVLLQCDKLTDSNTLLKEQLEETIKTKDNVIIKLNARIEGLINSNEKQLTEYINESKTLRKEKLAKLQKFQVDSLQKGQLIYEDLKQSLKFDYKLSRKQHDKRPNGQSETQRSRTTKEDYDELFSDIHEADEIFSFASPKFGEKIMND